MTNKHYIPLQNETLDQFKALVNLTLAARDQLTALTPAQLQPQLAISLQYFQALKDNDFTTVAPPPGFVEANRRSTSIRSPPAASSSTSSDRLARAGEGTARAAD